MHIIIKIKVQEELDKYIKEKENKRINENAAEDYETLLRKEESEIRQHIRIEHQFKLHCDILTEKILELENDNYLLAKKIVNKYFYDYNYFIGKTKKEIRKSNE